MPASAQEGSRPRRAGRGGEAPGGAAPCSPRPAGGRLRDASLPLRGGSRRRGRGRPPPAAAGHARTSRLRPRPRQTPEPTRPGRSPPGRRRRPRLHGSGLQLPHSRPWTMGNQLAPLPAFLPPLQALHVVVVGLDAAGKTSLLYRLKFQEFVQSVPTKGFNMEKIRVLLGGSRAITFQVWDVGGQEKLRPLWKSYTRCTDGLVFVVDSTEAERLEEARAELHKIARTSDNQGVPVLVLANKQDVAWALSVSEVEKALSLQELGTATLSHVQGCSALSGLGLQQGLEKLYEMILQRKKLLRSSKKRC